MSTFDTKMFENVDLLDSLNDGVYAVDVTRRIVYWNAAAERLTGWRAEDIVGKKCSAGILCHVDKDDHPLCGREHCPLHRAMVTDTHSHVPIVVFGRHKNGGQVPMRVSVAPIHNEAGEVIGGVETFREVSEEHHDVVLARRIQSAMLRRPFPRDDRVQFAAHYIPLGMVGGDYYATARVDDDRVAFMLADVCGHGIAAALYTIYLNALWQGHLDLVHDPAELARVMNSKLGDLIDDEGFATAVLGVLDLAAMEVTLVSAGGPSPLLFRRDGEIEELKGSGVPFGFPVEMTYDAQVVSVRLGDCFLAFTDGAQEVSDADGALLGTEGLTRVLNETGYPLSHKFQAVEERLLTLSNRIRLDDDLTFLEMRILERG